MPAAAPSSEPASAPRTARERARRELTREIVETARAQVAEHGAPELSLRAVSRELGMASSAIYRYFPSRDELLTALIIEAYEAVGAVAAETHEIARAERLGHGDRWLAVCRAVRGWAAANPREWALVYGSPIVGYEAPADTIEPASQVARVLAAVALDAHAEGALVPPTMPARMPPVAADGVLELTDGRPAKPFADLAERCLAMWITMIGVINFELFGHLTNVVTDHDAYFDAAMAQAAAMIGLVVPLAAGGRTTGRSKRTTSAVSRRG